MGVGIGVLSFGFRVEGGFSDSSGLCLLVTGEIAENVVVDGLLPQGRHADDGGGCKCRGWVVGT